MGNGRRVAILGGGMAGLATAWRLTDPDIVGRSSAERIEQVTVYQRGHRLGGKAASHRGPNGRIEEHGLHVWLGYYDNAFRLIRGCYDVLDRGRTDPTCPVHTWLDAFFPAPLIGLEDLHDGDWRTWTAAFPPNDRLPGQPLGSDEPYSAAEFLRQSIRLMTTFVRSLGPGSGDRQERFEPGGRDLGAGVALAGIIEVEKLTGGLRGALPLFEGIEVLARTGRERLASSVLADDRSRRLWQLLDLISAQVKGMVRDDLVTRGFRSIDHLEYRQWIAANGASPETLDGALVRGLYDLAFSHRGGDHSRTEFPAGLGLFLATKTFFDYRGALFWKMKAGMGDVVIAPLYQALVERGVRFEFFHRVDELVTSGDGRSVDAVRLGRQVDLEAGRTAYDPLVRVGGLPCFPARADVDQLAVDRLADGDVEALATAELESFWSRWPDAATVSLERGRDYDELVFALPVGMARHVTARLAERSPQWRTMLDTIETVGTQAFQLWLRPTEEELGWPDSGSTVTSFVDSYDTWASMTHLVDVERWPAVDRPGTIAYFCSSLAHEPTDDPSDPDQPRRAHAQAREDAIAYLESSVGHYWPNAIDDDGRFRWELLVGAGDQDGPAAIDSQWVTANVDPSDRYVQALPGTDQARLRPDRSGFAHLHLAGDWTDCGLNAGCIEAAVLSGLEAGNSVLGLPLMTGITGGYEPTADG